MKTVPLAAAKAGLSGLVDEVARRDERVTITKRGRPKAVLMSPADVDGLEATIEVMSDPEFYAEVLRGKRALEAGRAKLYTEEEVFGPGEEAGGRSTSRVPRAGTGGRPRAPTRRQATSPRGGR